MKKFAVLLSGCGVFDGSEIYESVITFLALERHGVKYQCFAPDIQQLHVIDHTNGEPVDGMNRNVLTESARLARGEIKAISDLNVEEFDALLVPGGFGAAKNFSDFALNGADAAPNEDVVRFCREFKKADKPAGYMCIAPSILPFVYGPGIKLTIGDHADFADALNRMKADHHNCPVDDIVVDEQNQVVTTPAYMLAGSLSEAQQGIDKLVEQVIKMS